LEVRVVASSCPDEGRPANEGGDHRAGLPFRSGGHHHPAHTEARAEARAEVRDRETYYADLRFAVHCESRSIPAPRAALDDREDEGTEGESWDEMIARFDDTWT
jgi:hypothetical protein